MSNHLIDCYCSYCDAHEYLCLTDIELKEFNVIKSNEIHVCPADGRDCAFSSVFSKEISKLTYDDIAIILNTNLYSKLFIKSPKTEKIMEKITGIYKELLPTTEPSKGPVNIDTTKEENDGPV